MSKQDHSRPSITVPPLENASQDSVEETSPTAQTPGPAESEESTAPTSDQGTS